MNTQDIVFDIDQSTFIEKAVEASASRVIVVDFWADWCGPCKMLGPLLEQIVMSYDGRVALAKVNVDQNQALAAQFGVQSIPTVKILKDKAIVQEFVGVLPEPQIREFLDPLLGDDGTVETESVDDLIAEGKISEARGIYEAMLLDDENSTEALLGLARINIMDGDTETARNRLEKIGIDAREYQAAQSTLAAIEFLVVCGDVDDRKALPVKFESGDLNAGYKLGCCKAAEGKYREALEIFLAVVTKDRTFEDGKAREAMISIFGIIGEENELVGEFRQKLANVLF